MKQAVGAKTGLERVNFIFLECYRQLFESSGRAGLLWREMLPGKVGALQGGFPAILTDKSNEPFTVFPTKLAVTGSPVVILYLRIDLPGSGLRGMKVQIRLVSVEDGSVCKGRGQVGVLLEISHNLL